MVESIPTYTLTVSEGFFEVDTNPDNLFGYCIEATKGPLFTPTFCASNEEVIATFGVSFAPHFYQEPTGVVITRVAPDGATMAEKIYESTLAVTEGNVTALKNMYDAAIIINPAAGFYTDSTTVVAKTKQYLTAGLEALSTVKDKYDFLINQNSVEEFLKQERESDNVYDQGTPETDIVFGSLVADQSYIKSELIKVQNVHYGTESIQVVITESLGVRGGYNLVVNIEGVMAKSYQSIPTLKSVAKKINDRFGNYIKATFINEVPEGQNLIQYTDYTLLGGSNGKLLDQNGIVTDIDIDAGRDVPTGIIEDPLTTLQAYRKGFESLRKLDLLGVATISNSSVVQNELIEHINEMIDPEVAKLRQGVTGFLDYGVFDDGVEILRDEDALKSPAANMNSEYIVYIGQGVRFKEDNIVRDLPPHECTMLYTGLRSSLGYKESLFGGQDKKTLVGVEDVLPLYNTGEIIVKNDIEALNEAGVCTFLQEYGAVKFVEGVTTNQESDVLSQESIMSIVIYVVKQLIRDSKPYQGQNLTDDLKASLETKLRATLQTIMDRDKTLIAIKNPSIPPFDVVINSAAVNTFDEKGRLKRESKLIVKVKIVPVGALRDITVGVITI